MFVNSEAIYGVRPWVVTNEGDVWFTKKKDGGALYAIVDMATPWSWVSELFVVGVAGEVGYACGRAPSAAEIVRPGGDDIERWVRAAAGIVADRTGGRVGRMVAAVVPEHVQHAAVGGDAGPYQLACGLVVEQDGRGVLPGCAVEAGEVGAALAPVPESMVP